MLILFSHACCNLELGRDVGVTFLAVPRNCLRKCVSAGFVGCYVHVCMLCPPFACVSVCTLPWSVALMCSNLFFVLMMIRVQKNYKGNMVFSSHT